MDVMCIDDRCAFYGTHPYLKYGSVYEATGEALNVDGQDCYVIPELPISASNSGTHNKGPLYKKSRFIRLDLPDATADEMADEKHEAIANLETVLV